MRIGKANSLENIEQFLKKTNKESRQKIEKPTKTKVIPEKGMMNLKKQPNLKNGINFFG